MLTCDVTSGFSTSNASWGLVQFVETHATIIWVPVKTTFTQYYTDGLTALLVFVDLAKGNQQLLPIGPVY